MRKIYPTLTYAGAIPFIIFVICLLLDISQLPWLGSTENILSVYTLVISTFLAGAHWGQHLHIQGRWHRALPIVSTIMAVVLWLAFILLGFKALTGVFVAAFVILLLIDQRLFHDEVITRPYFQTRCFVSAIVILTLIISGMIS